MDEAILNEIEEALRNRRITVERIEDTFNVRQGEGIMAHKAHLDPRPFVESLTDDALARRREIAGYVSGIKHMLLEPKRSKASEWGFVDTVGRLLPSLQVSTFEDGVLAASGEPAWTLDFVGDLRWAYLIHLDRGMRALTRPQVERWGVTSDRVTAGARSLLFHKTRNLSPAKLPDYDGVFRLHGGDGHDAARSLVVADVFYTELDAGFRFALPSPEHFIFVRAAHPASLAELSRATNEIFTESDYPLSDKIYRFDTGKPVVVEE